MILNHEREPKYSLYYIGSTLLNLLKLEHSLTLFELHNYLKKEIDDDLDINFLYLSLDWLFILNTIELNGETVSLCY